MKSSRSVQYGSSLSTWQSHTGWSTEHERVGQGAAGSG